ncbi:MAG: PP2C family protein-serine/threonine phosphatase, partial [Methylococcales bacterium]
MNLRVQDLFSYLRDQWVTVLIAVGIVATAAYLVLITDLRDQEGDSIQLTLSAHQSFYIEDIGLTVLELINAPDQKSERKIRGRLLDSISRLEDMHLSLTSGDKFIQQETRFTRRSGSLSPELAELYYGKRDELDRQVKDYIKAAKGVLSLAAGKIERESKPVAFILSDARHRLVNTLEKAVSLYQSQTDYRFSTTQNLQTFMYLLTMLSLLLVGAVMLKPLIGKLNDSMKNLREEKDFTQNILNTSQALIIALDSDARIVMFNAFAEEITGWREAELLGEEFFTRFIPDEDRTLMQQAFQEMFLARNVDQKEMETLLTIRSNEQLSIYWHTSVVSDPSTGQVNLFLVTGIDVTERKRAEQGLHRALAEVGELNAHLQDEIRLAAALQKVLLPDSLFTMPGMSGRTVMKTSSEVGGDYYDYYRAGESATLLFIGDVSGHGVAAGTMVSAAKAGVSPLIHQGIFQPCEILQSLNGTIRETAHESFIMTMLCLYFDASSGELVVANAGHVLPFHYNANSRNWAMLESFGFPLGQDPDFDYAVSEIRVQLEIGDRLFLYTDGLVEEESPSGEPFGYDRLEQLLNDHSEAGDETLGQTVLNAVRGHGGRENLADDITLVMVRHTDRVQPIASTRLEAGEIVKVSESAYRTQMHSLPRISRQYVVFMAEGDYSDLLKRFTEDGIRRVLPVQTPFYQRLDWNHLMRQHLEPADDDIYQLMPAIDIQRQFQITDTDDKSFIIEETQAWLMEQGSISPEHIDSLIIVLDEMIENGLYAAPRDGQNRQLYPKGDLRRLHDNEKVLIDIAIGGGLLGLMVTDHWGTFTPAIFLKYMTQTLTEGIEPGIGGGGMYLMWFLSDYLQVRACP